MSGPLSELDVKLGVFCWDALTTDLKRFLFSILQSAPPPLHLLAPLRCTRDNHLCGTLCTVWNKIHDIISVFLPMLLPLNFYSSKRPIYFISDEVWMSQFLTCGVKSHSFDMICSQVAKITPHPVSQDKMIQKRNSVLQEKTGFPWTLVESTGGALYGLMTVKPIVSTNVMVLFQGWFTAGSRDFCLSPCVWLYIKIMMPQ